MLQTLKKAFFAVLPSLRKAAEDALRDNAQQSQAQTNDDSEQPRNQAPVLLSLRPLNSRVRRDRAQTIQETIAGLLTLSILPHWTAIQILVRSCGLGFLTKKTILRGKTARSYL